MSAPEMNNNGLTASMTEVLATTIAAVVERQLEQFAAAMTQQVEHTKTELRSEFSAQIAAVAQRLETGQRSTEE